MNQKDIKKVEETIKETLERMCLSDFSVIIQKELVSNDENLVFNISTPDSSLLIGQQGETLRAFEHLMRVISRKILKEKTSFAIDVNRYRSEKTDSLRELARNMAQQALEEKRPVILRPMSAYERRIVHMELAGDERIKTESIGEANERKIVVKPVGVLESP